MLGFSGRRAARGSSRYIADFHAGGVSCPDVIRSRQHEAAAGDYQIRRLIDFCIELHNSPGVEIMLACAISDRAQTGYR